MTAHRNLRLSLTLIGASALLLVMASPAAAPPGDLDPTFETDGKVTTDFADSLDQANAVAIQADGKIVTAGSTRFSGTPAVTDFALARYNTNGSLDTTFGVAGKVTTDFGGSAGARAVAIQGDGRIVAAGVASLPAPPADTTSYDFALARYNPDGSLDTTFGVGGRVTTDFVGLNDEINDVVIQGDGRIVAAGSYSGDFVSGNFALARYNTDGSLDTTFGVAGKVTTDFVGRDDEASAVAIQGEEAKIVAAGHATVPGTSTSQTNSVDFALARYNADGSPDPTFGVGGRVTTDFDGWADKANAVVIQGSGKIVAAGFAFVSGTSYDFALARYRSDLEADLSITKTGPPGRVPTGRDMTYTLAVTNNGPDEASEVVVTDTLPPSVTFVGAVIDLPVGFCDPPSGDIITCQLGPIGSGVERRVYITVKPTQAGMITNSASVTSATPDYNQANNTDSLDTTICRITSRRSSIPCG